MHSRTVYLLTSLAAGMSLGHHLDHLIRQNAVGWPVTDEVNAFGAVVAWGVIESICRQWASELGPHGIRVAWLRTAGIPESIPDTPRPRHDRHHRQRARRRHATEPCDRAIAGAAGRF
jgi:hypothetical protein